MSFLEFLTGLISLGLAGAFTAFTAFRLRARLLPGYTGAPGRLVEVVAAVGLLVVGSELLGLVGLLKPLPLLPLLGVCALVAWLWLMPEPVGPNDPVPPSPPVSIWAQVLAALVAFVVFAQWATFTSYNLDHGITNFDSVWYHMPFAAEIARSASVTGFFHPETVFTNWFYPQNSELFHAISMVLTGRDFFSVFINLGWLGVALLAGWCVGRPFNRPHLTMVGVAILLATHTLVVREPGTGKNDIMAVALVLAAVAIMLNRSSTGNDPRGRVSPDWAMAAGGLAIGLAAGTKVTALAPAFLFTCAVIFSTVRGKRLRALVVFLVPAMAGGGWWYLRNLFAAGNPLPQVTSIGPIDLSGPVRLQVGRPDFSVAHYLTDTTVWREYFAPGLNQGFGEVWPVLLGLVLIGLFLVIYNGPGRLTRTHGAVALFAIVAYLVTPLGAAGPEGSPTAFAINLRFLIPALGLAVVIIPLSATFDRGWPRTLISTLLVLLFIGTSAGDPVLSAPGRAFGFALALLLVGLPAIFWLNRERLSGRFYLPPLAIASILALAVFALFAWPLQKSYFENRYQDFESEIPTSGLEAPYRWADDITDSKIALAGTTAGFKQYGFFGPDLSNEVVYVGQDAPKGGFNAIGTCEEFARKVNEINPDYLVTSPYLNFNDYEMPIDSPETLWALNDRSLQVVVQPVLDSSRPVIVWRVDRPLDPERCRAIEPGDDYIPGLK